MATKKITLNELRTLVKQIIKEEVNPITGLESEIATYNKMDVTDADIMLGKRLEKFLSLTVLNVSIQPSFRNTNINKSPKPNDEYIGAKWLNFTVDLGKNNHYGDIEETVNKINKFFSSKPNNYEILSEYKSTFKINADNNGNLKISFEVRDLNSTKEKPKLRKDMMSLPMGNKRKYGGF
jgi:hypothetical protein